MLNFVLLFALSMLCLVAGYMYGKMKGHEEIGISKELAEHLDEFRFEHISDVVKMLRQTKELAGMVASVSGNVADMLETIVKYDECADHKHIIQADSIGKTKVTTAEEWDALKKNDRLS